MLDIELDAGLERPDCPRCGRARIRPTDIQDGRLLLFECRHRGCRWAARARLPEIRKTIIYLDTSTVSHIARARQRNERQSPWIALYESLRRAAADEVIACPGSSIVRSETDLSTLSGEIATLAEELCDPGLKHQLEVQRAQISACLDRYLAGEPALPAARPPAQDAFRRNVHKWHSVFKISFRTASLPEIVESSRRNKVLLRDKVGGIFGKYEKLGYDFETIRKKEADAYGQALVAEGKRCALQLLGLVPVSSAVEQLSLLAPTTFHLVSHILQERHGMAPDDALTKAEELLLSEHVSLTPVAAIGAKLLAGLAILCRGPTPRKLGKGDYIDVEHISTYLPYVDVFIADRFFTALCNQPHVALGETYGTDIRRLSENNIDEFIQYLEGLRASAPHAELAGRLSLAITEGGYHQERADAIREYLRLRGWDPPVS